MACDVDDREGESPSPMEPDWGGCSTARRPVAAVNKLFTRRPGFVKHFTHKMTLREVSAVRCTSAVAPELKAAGGPARGASSRAPRTTPWSRTSQQNTDWALAYRTTDGRVGRRRCDCFATCWLRPRRRRPRTDLPGPASLPGRLPPGRASSQPGRLGVLGRLPHVTWSPRMAGHDPGTGRSPAVGRARRHARLRRWLTSWKTGSPPGLAPGRIGLVSELYLCRWHRPVRDQSADPGAGRASADLRGQLNVAPPSLMRTEPLICARPTASSARTCVLAGRWLCRSMSYGQNASSVAGKFIRSRPGHTQK